MPSRRPTFIVEYSDETGGQRRTDYAPDYVVNNESQYAIDDVFAVLTMQGIDIHAPYRPEYVDFSIRTAADAYACCGTPWDSVYEIGYGDDNFVIFGHDASRGNWSVSLTMVREA